MPEIEHEGFTPRETATKPRSITAKMKSKLAEVCIEHHINVTKFVPSDLAGVLPDNFTVLEDGSELRVLNGSNYIRFSRASLCRLVKDKARNMGWSEDKIEKLIAAADA